MFIIEVATGPDGQAQIGPMEARALELFGGYTYTLGFAGHYTLGEPPVPVSERIVRWELITDSLIGVAMFASELKTAFQQDKLVIMQTIVEVREV